MANNIRQTTVELELLISELGKLDNTLNKTSLNKLNETLKVTSEQAKEMSRVMSGDMFDGLDAKELDRIVDSISELQNKMSNMSGVNLSNKLSEISNSFKEASRSASNFSVNFNSNIISTTGITSAISEVNKLSNAFKEASNSENNIRES